MPQFVPVERLPKWLNKRRLQDSVASSDDSALNLAMFELLRLRRVVLDTRFELKGTIAPFIYSGDLSSTTTLALQLRDYLGISYEMQKATTSARKFFLLVRSRIEEKGVMVAGFDRVPLAIARGIALYFDELPIIGVNSEDRPPAKTFSMIHELVHVLKRQSAACNEIGPLPSLDEEEVFCNAVAGEFLVPADLLRQENEVGKMDIDVEAIAALASRYSVSREVIARRLLDQGRIQPHEYETFMENFRAELEAERNAPRNSSSAVFHRNMVREAFDRNGTTVCRVLQNGLDHQIYSQQDVGDFLGIKLRNIPRLFEEASRW
jgi:Zn-dependent peptidase ImmA (M78 family)